jgi:hypothetical protein
LWVGGWVQQIREERTPLLFALGIEAEILLPLAKDCSGKPDPEGMPKPKYSWFVNTLWMVKIKRIKS